MRLLLKLRRIGSQTYRNYVVDEELLLPAEPLVRPHEWLLAELCAALTAAQRAKTFVRIPVKTASGAHGIERKIVKFYPSHYRVCTVEWET